MGVGQPVHDVDSNGAVAGTRSVDRALSVLDAVAERAANAAELAAVTGVPRPSVIRILNALRQRNYVDRRADGAWEVGTRVLTLASRWYDDVGIARVAHAELETLAQKFSESAYVCIREGLWSLCVAGVESPRSVRFSLSIGARTHLHAGAINEVLLAYSPPATVERLVEEGKLSPLTPKTITSATSLRRRLAAIKERGWCETDSEADEGVTSIAAPIFVASSRFEASLGVSGPSGRLNAERRREIRDEVVRTAERLTRRLGGRSQSDVRRGVAE